MSKPWAKDRYLAYALGEIMVLSGSRNLATGLRGVTVRSSGSLERGLAWGRDNLIDGQSVVGAPLAKSDRPLAHGWESSRFSAASSVAWVQIDLGELLGHLVEQAGLGQALDLGLKREVLKDVAHIG